MSEILQVLYESRHPQDKGARLELMLVELLKDLGFQGVRRQLSGSQYGFDLVAFKDSPADGRREIWKFECKNLSKQISVEDIAPKLLWQFGQATIDRFVIVGPSAISNDLHHLLEQQLLPMPVSVWTDEVLERFIRQSPRALKLLGLNMTPSPGFVAPEDALSYEPKHVTLDVVHQLNPPFAFDYVKTGDGVVKAFTDDDLRMLVAVTNLSKTPVEIHTLEVSTLSYQKIAGRVLRLHKMKGLYEPLELSFSPSQVQGGSVELLGKKVWRVDGGAAESVALIMNKGASPGLYHLMFRIRGTLAGKGIDRCSPCFVLHVCGDETDLVSLYVLRRHYDTPAALTLELKEPSWELLRRETKNPDVLTFLGPTFHEAVNGYKDQNWVVRALKINPKGDGSRAEIDSNQPSLVVLDLGTPVDEELHCGKLAILKRAFSVGEWQDIFPTQLRRRLKEG
jgi:hypothetical protein